MKVIQQNAQQHIPHELVGIIFPVFAIDGTHGVKLVPHSVRAAPEVELWSIKVGETGHGRWESTLLVDRSVPDEHGERIVRFARLAETRTCTAKLIAAPPLNSPADYACVVLNLGVGFQGGNGFTGDVVGRDPSDNNRAHFARGPWLPIAIGRVAIGEKATMGVGRQMIALLPRGVVGRTFRSGKLDGEPATHYYIFDGEKLYRRTRDERVAGQKDPANPFPVLL